MKKVLIVDDEPEIIRVVRGYLNQAGYRVTTAADGTAALEKFRQERPDIVILDINLPTAAGGDPLNGLDVARHIRRMPGQAGATPIIMLTARVEEMDRIIGLELGADDYVTKPFSPRELVARVRAVLRRGAPAEEAAEILTAGPLTLDLAGYDVTLDGKPMPLTRTEFTLLKTMMARPGRAFTREQLLDSLGADYAGLERTVDSHIKNLRAKLERDPRNPEFILTVFGVGYKFNDLL
ncbi:MAG: response regulator transcription factor [Anaerolineae bacterium]